MADILDDSRFQFDAAEEKLQALNGPIDSFLKGDPYSFVVNIDPATGEHVFKARIRKSPPPIIPKTIADALQDMRTGLDYIAFAFAERESGTAPTGTEFPIFFDPGQFRATDKSGKPGRGSGFYKIRGINGAIQAVIEGLQPFSERPNDPKGHPLWMIHDLNIIAKHRKPLLTGAVANVGFGIVSGYISSATMNWGGAAAAIKPGAFHDNAELGRMQLAPGTHMQVKLIPTYDVAFDKASPARGEMARDTLRLLLDHIRSHVLPKLEVFV